MNTEKKLSSNFRFQLYFSNLCLSVFICVQFNPFGGEGGIRTHVRAFGPQVDFESTPLRPLRYLSVQRPLLTTEHTARRSRSQKQVILLEEFCSGLRVIPEIPPSPPFPKGGLGGISEKRFPPKYSLQNLESLHVSSTENAEDFGL
jgi:hypothetical protein